MLAHNAVRAGFLALGLAAAGAAQAAPDVVKIAQGTLQGTASDEVESFKGIPFAAPPVGDCAGARRGPAPSWTGVRKAADAFGPICMQRHRGVSARTSARTA